MNISKGMIAKGVVICIKKEYGIGFFYKFYLLNIIETLKYHCLKNSIYI